MCQDLESGMAYDLALYVWVELQPSSQANQWSRFIDSVGCIVCVCVCVDARPNRGSLTTG